MPYLIVRLTQPKQTVTLGFGPRGVNSCELIEYYANGLSNQAPLFFGIREQPTSVLFGNVTQSLFPLMFKAWPETSEFLNIPIQVLFGSDIFNNSVQVEFDVYDVNHNPAIFSSIILVFRVNIEHPCMEGVTFLEQSMFQA